MCAAADLARQCLHLRNQILDMVHRAGSGHCGGSLSCVEILWTLYSRVLRVRPDDPHWEDRDRFILSKGHAAPALYAVLAARGFFDPAELDTLRRAGSMLQGHPDMHKTPGVEMSTGSLGMGISAGVGMALGADVSSSTQTRLFAEAFPQRFFNFGIAEANMVSAAAGLSTAGFVPVVSSFALPFCIGKGIPRRGGHDVALIATGTMVPVALEASEYLEAEGVAAVVIDLHTLKPLDEELIVQTARGAGAVITVEEHSIIGGLGSAVCETLCRRHPAPVVRCGIPDRLGESGAYAEILSRAGLDVRSICQAAHQGLELKRRLCLNA